MNQIKLERMGGMWHARYLGDHASEIKALFNTDTIPTAFDAKMKPGLVLKQIAKLNPNAQIGIEAAAFGPATTLACIEAGYGTTLWMKPGWQPD